MDGSNDHVVIDVEISGDQVSIDLESLAGSLTGEFENLHPLSEDCCIWQMPLHIRKINENPYVPKIVSIGPIHHNRGELKDMENDKLRYLHQFLGRTEKSVVEFLREIKNKETRLRRYYGESIEYASEGFVKMILLDAVFLLELFLRCVHGLETSDGVYTRPGLMNAVVFDILLFDNQLPIFILNELYEFARPEVRRIDGEGIDRGVPLNEIVGNFLEFYVCKDILIDANKIAKYFSDAKHFIDLLWCCLLPPNYRHIHGQKDSKNVPSITQLNSFGVKFLGSESSDKSIFDIKFDKNKKTLAIPKLTISSMTVHLLRNLQIFESLRHPEFNLVNDYNIMLNYLLRTPNDVELLVRAGVIENQILDGKELSMLFQGLYQSATVRYRDFYYSSIAMDLQDYCKSRRQEWIAYVKIYLTPFVVGSVLAASTTFVLTFIQTFFAMRK